MNKKFKFSCGCSFDYNEKDKSIIFDYNIENINIECERTWQLIGEGNTKGIFQLESRLGSMMAKKLKPENIEQLSALISIIRPGALDAIRDGKSVTNHYVDKKNGLESIDYFHSSLEPSLKSTLGEMIYQEQAMQIAKDIAGFDLKEADNLRKSIAKKQSDKMAVVKSKFLEGCKSKNIVNENEAEQIFGWIEKGQRYSFNKSHGVSYAINAYLSAYVKAHFPKEFFAAYLKFAKNKVKPQDEIKALIQNAREMNIDVVSPDIRKLNAEFILQDDMIYFGLTDIKGVGESVFNKLQNTIDQNNIDIVNIDWINLLYKILVNINSTASKSLIEAGALDFTKKSRSSMLYEYQLVSELTKKELQFIIDNISSSKNIKNDIIYLLEFGKINKNRKKVLENILNMLNNPSYSLNDNPEWIADVEYNALGCSLTCSKVDMYDISMTNISCKELKNSVMFDSIILGGEVEYANVTKTKTGQNKGQEMAFVSLSDSTGVADSIIFFPEQYKKYKNILFSGNVIILKGNKTKTGDGLIVEKAYIAKT